MERIRHIYPEANKPLAAVPLRKVALEDVRKAELW